MSVTSPAAQIHTLTITVLSIMLVGEAASLGEWGFSASVEANGHRILLDTGSHPETVLKNARDLNIDLYAVLGGVHLFPHLTRACCVAGIGKMVCPGGTAVQVRALRFPAESVTEN